MIRQVSIQLFQQETLIVQLQDQHFQQYIQQTHTQQLVHQRQQYAQLQALTRTDGDESQNPEQLIIPPSIPLLQDSEAQQTIEYVSEGTGSQEERLENGGPLLEKESENPGQEKDTEIDTAQQEREINLEDETAFNDKIWQRPRRWRSRSSLLVTKLKTYLEFL